MDYLLGCKLGMTHVFSPDGGTIPVTVVEGGPCTVVQRKTQQRDGYDALQIGFLPRKEKGVAKPLLGHFRKAGVQPFRILREVPLGEGDEAIEPGAVLDSEVFDRGDWVDVTAASKGRGFAGVMKRHGFKGGPGYHGAHFHRAPGSIGASADPARVFPGTRLPGQMGNVRVTQTGLTVVATDPDKNLVLVKGAIPGSKGSLVVIRG